MKKWIIKNSEKLRETDLSKDLNISPELMRIMENRGIDNYEKANIFLNPSLVNLRDPFLLKDMDKAVERILKALTNNEKICIFGDYDVDGVSSTSILILFFKSIGVDVDYYIPNRLEEGYGLSNEALDKIHNKGNDLVITVDCGITSVKEADYARDLGVDLIITDHHECQAQIPRALAVINPKRPDDTYPFDMFCGCGIALKLIQALSPSQEAFLKDIDRYLEIVAMASICDMVPLVDENRIIVKNGLELMKVGLNPGIKALFNQCEITDKKIGSSHIGYAIGPRINAAGRLGYSDIGVKLLTSSSLEEAKVYSKDLDEKNNYRQELEAQIYERVEEILESDPAYKDERVIVAADSGWQHGIIGIVASKISEKYYKPTILLNVEGELATGSARSIKGFNLFEALSELKDLFSKFGGHEQAAGMTLPIENIDKLRKAINRIADIKLDKEDMIEKVKIEFEASESNADLSFLDDLHKLEPYGIGNPTPRFVLTNLRIENKLLMGKLKNHIKFELVGIKKHECVGFNMAHLDEDFQIGDLVDIAIQMDKNTFMGKTKLQLILKDMKKRQPGNFNLDRESFYLDYLKVKRFSNLLESEKLSIEGIGNFEKEIPKFEDKVKLLDDISFLSKAEKTLIISETKQGFFVARSTFNTISDHEVYTEFDGKELTGKYNIYLYLAPTIDKIDLNMYDNIVFEDLPRMGVLKYINDKFIRDLDGGKIPKLFRTYNSRSKIIRENDLEQMNPSREDFVLIYRQLSAQKEVSYSWNDIQAFTGLSYLKLFSIFEIFSQAKLLSYKFDKQGARVDVKLLAPPKEKVNLEDTDFKKNINNLSEIYGR